MSMNQSPSVSINGQASIFMNRQPLTPLYISQLNEIISKLLKNNYELIKTSNKQLTQIKLAEENKRLVEQSRIQAEQIRILTEQNIILARRNN